MAPASRVGTRGAGVALAACALTGALVSAGAVEAPAPKPPPPPVPAPVTAAATAAPVPVPVAAAADAPEMKLTKLWEYTPTLKSTDLCLDVGGKDGSLVATCGSSKTVRLLGSADGKETWSVLAHDGDVAAAAVSNDGAIVITGARDGKAKAWKVKDSTSPSWLEKKDGWFMAVDVTPDGKRAVVGDHTGFVRTFPTAPGAGSPPVRNVNEYAIRALRIAPDGKKVAVTDDVAVSIYPLPKGARSVSLEGPGGSITAVVWSDDGKRLVGASDTGLVRIWDVDAKYKEVGTFDTTKPVAGIALSPKGMKFGAVGAQLVTAHEDGTIVFWDSKTFAKLGWVKAHASTGGVAVAANGKTLVTIGDEGVVAAWSNPFPALELVSSGVD